MELQSGLEKRDYFEVISFYNSITLIINYDKCNLNMRKKLKYLKNEGRESKTER